MPSSVTAWRRSRTAAMPLCGSTPQKPMNRVGCARTKDSTPGLLEGEP